MRSLRPLPTAPSPCTSVLTVLSALAALLVLPPAAVAAPVAGAVPRAGNAGGTLVLSVTDGPGRIQSVSLECSRTSEGTHPDPGTACAQITAARGDFGALPHTKARCPALKSPVTATATGTWRGKGVNWQKRYDSYCALAAHTGAVFDF